MLKCKLCGFECTFRTTMESHLANKHKFRSSLSSGYIPLYGVHETVIFDVTRVDEPKDDISIPDPVVIDSGISGGGGDFGGGGASGDY